MDIITEKENENRMIDGINTLLNLDDLSFDTIIEALTPNKSNLENIRFFYTTDGCENPSADIQLGLEKSRDENGEFISRCYYGGKRFSIPEIFKVIENYLKNLKEDSPEHSRINRLLKTRNLEALKAVLLADKLEDKPLLEKVFEIVSNDETCQKFLDYNHNKDYFSIDGHEIAIGNYLKYLGKIFGEKDSSGNLTNSNTISEDFYVPKLDEYKQRYSQIFDRINMDRYINPTYEFKKFTTLKRISNTIIRKDEAPNWTINKELHQTVFQDMPKDFSLEEQAMYIYSKLCKELSYDEGYIFREHLDDGKYDSTFSQEHLENIQPGSKVTCWDFSRICSKMINELEGDIEAVIIAEGENYGHFLVGFYTDKVSAMLEAINATSDGTNDLMKAKNGIKLEGIEIVSDRNSIIEKVMEKVYPQVLGKSQSSIQEYLQELNNLPREEIPDNLEIKLQSFLDIMKENNISGNEATQTFRAFYHSGFFGEQLDCAFLGKEENQDGEKSYKRMALIRSKNEFQEKSDASCLYLMDSNSLELFTCTSQEIIDKLNSGEFIYENEKHQMPGINMEEK